MDLILDSKLLEKDFNPFQKICENPLDQRDQSLEYRAFHDYLISLKIVGERLVVDYNDLFKNSNRNSLDPSGWSLFHRYELDTDSFVIFTRILLDRVGVLIQKLSNLSPNNYIKSFTDLKKKCANIPELVLITPLLLNLNWYDHSLSFMRDNLIVHGGILAGSRRMIASDFKYNKTNSKFGFLSLDDEQTVRTMINKYGQGEKQILSIKPHRLLMLDEFLEAISKNNIKLDNEDLNKLRSIVQRNGCNLDVTILSKHVRKLLEDFSILYQQNLKNIHTS